MTARPFRRVCCPLLSSASRPRRRASAGSLVPVVLVLLLGAAARLSAQQPESDLPAGDAGQSFGTPYAQTGAATAAAPASDPPARVVRLSVLQGNVSAEPPSVDAFSPAELNQVLTTGDRLYTDPSASAELQANQMAVRLGGGTDLTVTAMTDTLAQFGLAAGSVHLRSFAIDPGTVLELDTPDVAVTVLQPGDVRVDVDAAAHTTTVLLGSGQVQVDSPGSSQVLAPGQRIQIHSADAATGQSAYPEALQPASPDALDGFSDARDAAYASGADAESPYVNPDTVGGADLATYGSWETCDYGPIWYPVVVGGWQPYRYGRWRWIVPWGWTWVGSEPWGFAPFHYGRWANLGNRWGWIPGPPRLHPVYAPALVAFAGGPQLSGAPGNPGGGVMSWFPLGPREPFAPWYHGSTLYLNRVNASNLYNTNLAEARGLYNQRAVNVFTSTPLTSRTFVNRQIGTVAVPEASFAAGREVGRNALHLSPEELAAAPVLAHPPVAPERSMLVPQAARATPPVLARPVLTGRAAETTAEGNTPLVGGTVLFHRAEPPSPRPGFEQQRKAMEAEPGRPLSVGQMETLRESRPAGALSHPAPSHPAPAPAPAHSAPPPAPAGHK